MKQINFIIGLIFLSLFLSRNVYSQNLEVIGKAKITDMDKVNTADSVVVRLVDGTLAMRDVSTLSEFQILSISNDTIYLTNGSFVKLPADSNAGWSMNVDTTSTTKYVGIGTSTPTATLDVRGSAVFNENSQNVDFRVESNNNQNMLFVDGGIHRVGIRTGTPTATLDVNGSAVFNNNASDFDFKVKSDNNQNMLFVDGGTNRVGIGTGTPNAVLDVRGDVVFNDGGLDFDFRVESKDTNPMLFVDGGTNRVSIAKGTPEATLDVNGSAIFNNSGTSNDFRVESNNNQNMLFVDGGLDRVGIGTGTPNSTLDVQGDAVFRGDAVFNEAGNDFDFRVESDNKQNMLFVDGGLDRVGIRTGSPNAHLDVRGSAIFNEGGGDNNFRVESNTNDNMLFVDGGLDRVGIGTGTPVAVLDVRGDAIFNDGGIDADFRVESNTNDNMLFVDGGLNRVGIGTSSPLATLHVNGKIQLAGAEYFEDGGTNEIEVLGDLRPSTTDAYDIGTSTFRWQEIFATNGTINTSDKKLKKDIEKIPYGLNEIMMLNPVRFRWKESHDPGYKLGLIAQELLPVLGEVVKTYDYEVSEEDETIVTRVELETLGVYYSDIIPVLIKGMQEQQAEIEELKDLVNQLISEKSSPDAKGQDLE